MLMVYLELGYAIRPIQERGERLFRVRRESLSGQSEKRVRQALTRLSRDDNSQIGEYKRLFIQSQG